MNVPIAMLIWLMITPMMMKVDFGSIRNVGRKPAGLFVTLAVNWLVKPFSMAPCWPRWWQSSRFRRTTSWAAPCTCC
jgi:ACR3 family arsenite efflux pump ArsB